MGYHDQFLKIRLGNLLFYNRFSKTEFRTTRIKRDARVEGVREKIHNSSI
jgi:hypothetical protein